ncbi:Protein FAM49A [Nymphon striatum]|nr:Protein FAM49A [Nymphon striatum]
MEIEIFEFLLCLKIYLCILEEMGNLLRLLSRDENLKYDVFVDFENAQPTECEQETCEIVESVLSQSQAILQELQQYKGAGNEIREAIANPRSEYYQEQAWDAVLPLVSRLKEFYEFSLQLATVALLPSLLL